MTPTQENPHGGQGVQPLTLSQGNSVQLSSQATVQLSNNSIVQHSWPHSSSYMLRPMSPHIPPGPAWPYSPYASLACYSPPASSYQPMLSPTTSSPFTLCKIGGNISTCSGCRNKYSKNAAAPDDMCIKHQEWREYTPPGSQVAQSRYGNVYYHFNPQCVWLQCSWFIPSQLHLTSFLNLAWATSLSYKSFLISTFHNYATILRNCIYVYGCAWLFLYCICSCGHSIMFVVVDVLSHDLVTCGLDASILPGYMVWEQHASTAQIQLCNRTECIYLDGKGAWPETAWAIIGCPWQRFSLSIQVLTGHLAVHACWLHKMLWLPGSTSYIWALVVSIRNILNIV